MIRRTPADAALTLLTFACLSGCANRGPHIRALPGHSRPLGEVYASEKHQLTGVAVSRQG